MPARSLLAHHARNLRTLPNGGAWPPRDAIPRLREPPWRRVVLRSALGTVAVVRYPATWSETSCATEPRLIMPLRGLVRYTESHGDLRLDSNSAVVMPPGDFRIDHPVSECGHVSLEVMLEPFAYRHWFGKRGTLPRPTTPKLRLLANRVARAECARPDEILLTMLREIVASPAPMPMRRTANIARIKDMIHGHSDEMLSLDRLARSIGICPAYLTQEFTRCEGIPLYRYQKQLRLAQALQDLPSCSDITTLALELGFSNHSHFTAAFRQEFGLTPSAYRAQPA